MKKVITSILLSTLFLLPVFVSAEDLPTNKDNPTSLHIADIVTDKEAYNAGDVVNGSFTLENHSQFAVTGLMFQLLIGADYLEIAPDLRSATKILDFSPRQGNISIPKGKSVNVPFKYTIPAFVGGNELAVHFDIYTQSGQLITWADSKYFSIKKGAAGIVINSAAVVLSNGETFGLGEGPTIYENKDPKTASLSLSVTNPNDTSVAITPQINLYKQSDMLEIQNGKGTPFDLKAKETRQVSIPLLTASYKPGVYLTDIILKDSNDRQLGSFVEARYIIGGSIATVQNISVDKEILGDNEIFVLDALLTGTAPDMSEIRKGRPSSSDSDKKGTVTVNIYNEKNELVTSINDTFLISGNTVLKRYIKSSAPAQALRASVMVYNDLGELILDYKKNLSADYDNKAAESTKKHTSLFSKLFSVILLLIIGLIVLIMMKKSKASGVGMTVLFMLVSAMTLFSPTNVHAADSLAITLSPASPYNWQVVNPGQAFYATGSVWYTACTNAASNIRVNVSSSWGETHRLGVIDTAGGLGLRDHGFYPHNTTFAAGPFYAPTTPGSYWLLYQGINTDTVYGGQVVDNRWISIVVPEPPVPPVLTYDGVCGSANGTGKSTKPSTNLCSSGAASTVGTQNGKWSWSCTGTNVNGSNNVSSCLASKTDGDNTGGGNGNNNSCASGKYCDGVCLLSGETCTDNFTPNPNIELENEGPVSLKSLNPSPSLGNKGYSCVIDWSSDVFKSYDNYTRCTITSGNQSVSFIPASTTSPTSFTVSNLQVDTSTKMMCTQVDGTATASKEAICRVNWSAVEVN
jgi:hypothetical protein